MTDEGEKRLVVERLYEKGKRAAFQRSSANRGCFPAGITITFVLATPRAAALALPGRSSLASTHRARPRGFAWLRECAKKTSAASKLCANLTSSATETKPIFCITRARMGLDRAKRDAESRADLLVEQPGYHQPEDLGIVKQTAASPDTPICPTGVAKMG